jgi:hypothetical protein
LGIYWKNVKNNGWGNKLQEFLKSGAPIPPGAYHAPYCGSVPSICIYNQRVAKMRLELTSSVGKEFIFFTSSSQMKLKDSARFRN